jgi:hypothetical protein
MGKTPEQRRAAALKAWETMRARYCPHVGHCMAKQAAITAAGGEKRTMHQWCADVCAKNECIKQQQEAVVIPAAAPVEPPAVEEPPRPPILKTAERFITTDGRQFATLDRAAEHESSALLHALVDQLYALRADLKQYFKQQHSS